MSTAIGRTGLTRINTSLVNAAQFPVASPSHAVVFDHFTGAALDTNKWTAVEGTDSATSAAAIASAAGGVLRLTTGDAGTGLAADTEQIVSQLAYKASMGGLSLETKIKLSAITTCYLFVGFTDNLSLEAPIESAGSVNTLTSNATDAVGFLFDTRMSTDTFHLVGVKNDVDATSQVLDVAPVAATYVTLRVDVSAAGDAQFFINGVQVGTVMTAAVTPTVLLTPTVSVSKTSVAASMTADLDYLGAACQVA